MCGWVHIWEFVVALGEDAYLLVLYFILAKIPACQDSRVCSMVPDRFAGS